MSIEMGRAWTMGLAAVVLVLATACASSSGGEPAPRRAPQRRPERDVADVPRPYAARGAPARAASCPMPSPNESGQLPLFSKVLFYVRENYPQDISPRSRDLFLGALEAVAQQDHDIQIEREPEPPPRWVTVTVGGKPCTLDIERVDAPWSLRSTLQQAFRFIQVQLASGPAAESEQRLSNLELAAISGMLSTLDRHSQLLDPETNRQIRAHLGPAKGAGALRANGPSKASEPAPRPWAALFPRAASGQTIGYLRLPGFPLGVADELGKSLLAVEGTPPKGFVLDLRDSSGGLVEEAARVADAFIKSGTLGSIAGQRRRQELVAHADGHEPSGALVVLVNRDTAGAAELVAAAIKNLGRGIVVGEPTAGAGMIDQLFEIPREGDPLGLYLTTGQLLAAGGAEIERAGVQPDVAMAWPPGAGSRSEEDCVRQFAEVVISRAHDAARATLLSTAKALPAEAACRSAGLRGL